MRLEHWMQLLVGVVILGGLGFLATNVFNMEGTLSSVSTEVRTTDQRLGRIADALPEVQARVAWEEVHDPLSGFIASTQPKKTDGNKWLSAVKLYDAETGKLRTYSILLEHDHKHYLSYVVAGKVRTENAYAPTFAELAKYSVKEKVPVLIPSQLNADTSFLLRTSNVSEYASFLKKITGKEPVVKKIGRLHNWKEVAPKLEELK